MPASLPPLSAPHAAIVVFLSLSLALCNLNYAWLFLRYFGQRSYLNYIKITLDAAINSAE